MRQRLLAVVVAVTAASTIAGCDKVRPVSGAAVASTSCTGCHGGLDNATGAPPRDTSGRTATSVITVGAHTAHVLAGLDCDACHVKPSRVSDPGHIDGNPKVTFGVLATLGGGAAPAFDPVSGTCSNVYCHGSKLPPSAQGQATAPVWTAPTLAGAPCGACHGNGANATGAPAGHGAGLTTLDCAACHPDSVLADGSIKPKADGGKHLDGHVDVGANACTGCHGDSTRAESTDLLKAAPPVDTAKATAGAKVGAHLRHVSTVAGLGSRLSKPFQCAECHVVPNAVPHGATAVVQFGTAPGTLAKGPAGSPVTPSYAAGTCSSTYCHGATLLGGTAKNPAWTGTAVCGTCHFLASPPAPHPANERINPALGITQATQCWQCHPGTVRPDGTIDVALGNHVNGSIEVKIHADTWVDAGQHGAAAKLDLGSCATASCHGANFAADVGGGKSCDTCHANPVAFIPGYTGATHPAWQSECTFCHGDANRAAVAAQDPAGPQAINAGKASPPLGSQAEVALSTSAVGAHQRHVSDDPVTGNRSATPFKCQQCHGVNVLSDADHQGVGHVDGQIVIGWQTAALAGAVPTPAAGTYPSARDASGAARASVTSCANYCHGATLAGGTKKDATGAVIPVSWIGGSAEGACGTCHGRPPPYAAPVWHPVNTDGCAGCHGYDESAMNLAKHVNGLLDLVTLTCTSCHGTAAAGNSAPPRAASIAGTATTVPQVGAHQAHVKGAALSSGILCTDCHGTLPTSMTHANGAVTLAWSALASGGGVTPVPDVGTVGTVTPGSTNSCANYCHGQKWVGNANYAGSHTSPIWTGTSAGEAFCGACHKVPPTSAAHASVTATVNCGSCHAGYSCTTASLATCTVNKTLHINGQTEGPNTCGGCHGSVTPRTAAAGTLGPVDSANNLQGAPPNDVAGQPTSNQVGPHQGHVNPASPGPQYYKPVLCSECHTAAVNAFSTGGHAALSPRVQFPAGTAAALGGTVTSYVNNVTATPDTCVTYCHGGSLTAAQKGVITTWQWATGVTVACNSCHATPPRDLVHTSVATVAAATTGLSCVPCHNTTLTATGAILFSGTGTAATTLHINGTRQNTAACNSCHGSATNDAPPSATSGTTATTNPKVGAHQKHVTGTSLRTASLACTECHVLPTVMTHATGAVDMTYGPLARTGTLTPAPATINPAWETTPTCTNYCHGQKWAGNANYAGAATAPSWIGTSTAVACNGCHLAPPSSVAHASVTASTSCSNCHTGYACTSGNLAACTVNKTVHLDGKLDVNVNSCGACHGSATARAYAAGTLGPQDSLSNLQGSPPNDALGLASSNPVGPHLGHVNPASPGPQYYKPVLCSECHTVAVNSFSPTGHGAISPKVQYGAGTAAALGGTTVDYVNNPAATPDTCVTYCHGGSLTAAQKGVITTWQWTTGVTVACNSCHATPPRDPVHASVATVAAATTGLSCVPCHNTTLTAAGAILFSGTGTAATTLHINGTRQNTATCTSCHGTLGANAAPPTATNGTTTGVKVGAHQKHVTGTSLRTASLACTDCHVLPTLMTHATGVVDMTYGALAKTGSLVPAPATINATWETTPTCTNYCHGQKWTGNANYAGSATAPSWNGTSTSAACNSCHLAPPSSTAHASVTTTKNCGDCHTGYSCTTGNLAACTVNKTVHLDGKADSNVSSCGACHGSATARAYAAGTQGPQDSANNLQGSPPNDAAGLAASNQVGPHLGHVNPGSPGPQYYKPVLCSECHTAAVSGFATSGHAPVSPKVQYPAGTAAALSGTVTSYVNNVTATPDTCVTYCHGGSLTAAQKGVITTWQWTTGVTVACNSCHATPPRDPVHASVATVAAATTGLSCVPCHNTTLTAAGAILFSGTGTAATTLHINGTRQNTATCTSCHGTLGVNAAPPTATNGTTTGVKVGAHQKHVTATNLKATALACTDCHVLPTLMTHATGTVDMTYGPLASTGTLTPTPATINATWEATPTCTNYCHGEKWIGNAAYAGTATSPSWNGTSTSAACNSCHLAPPASAGHASVSASTSCSNCHIGYACTSGNLAACTVNKTIHLDGKVDVNVNSCGACHGSATARTYAAGTQGPQDSANNLQGSPPNDSLGLPSSNQVGPHQGHVNPATPGPQYYKPVLCSECHTVAVNSFSPTGHGAISPKVQYGAGTAAVLSGTVTSYVNNPVATPDTCVTYCHGGSLTAAQKGVITTWQWTTGVTVACNSCHATPPRDPVHASVATVAAATTGLSCVPCHNTTLTAAGAILFSGTGTAATTLHINGTRQNTATCTSCHGTLGVNAAPPTATNGTTTGVKVGAHQKHVTATNLKATALACTDCHVLPTLMTHATGVVDMTYGTLAKTGSLVPAPATINATWEATPTCTNYCHGQKWAGNANYAGAATSPSWNGTSTSAACNSCHLAPPSSAAHASVTTTKNCGDCHTGYSCTTGNLAACTVNKTWHLNGVADFAPMSCGACHGSATARTIAAGTYGPYDTANNLQGSPPNDAAGLAASNQVGPHLGHVNPATPGPQYYKPVLCSECHTAAVNSWTSAGHTALSPKVQYPAGTAAALSGTVTSYVNNVTATPDTCVTYCHGGSLTAAQKGVITTWQWTTGVTVACNSCHATPPRDPVHTSVATVAAATTGLSCVPCHNTTLTAAGAILFSGTGTAATTLHINGTRQNTATCTSCHGTLGVNAAPPTATNGTTTGVKVGAHQKHVTATNLKATALACTDCHVLPTLMTHATGAVDMTYGALAKTGSLVPAPATINATWETTPTCTNYCHGQKWAGNANYAGAATAPSWNGTSTSAACNSCHLAPPSSTAHASVTTTKNCGDCHTGYSCTTGNLAACTVNKTWHLNGVADFAPMSCGACHGSATARAYAAGTQGPQDSANNLQGSPPNDAAGLAASNQVGPHLGHVNPATPGPQYYKPVLCSECHTAAVNSWTSAGHTALSPKVQYPAGTAAALSGTVTSYVNNVTATPDTCVTYCHGGSLTAAQKGVITTWQWTTGVTVACNSCHATPPRDPVHASVATVAAATTGLSCVPCHNTTLSATGAILFSGTGTAATTLHINGTRQNTATCTSCHGTLGVNAAPPTATDGTTTGVKVGAHQKHVTATTLRATALACTDCHVLPTLMTHATGVVDMTYGALAKTGSLVPAPATINATWEMAPTCTNYCHGQKWTGNAAYAGAATAPSWNGTSTSAACNSCHLAPPSSAAHASVTTTKNCGDCHTGYSCTTGNLAACTVNKTVHLDGKADVSVNSCGACHGSATARTIAAGTYGPYDTANNLQGSPPNDAAGLAASNQVGPHLGHVNPATPGPQYYKPVLCSECHTVAVNSFSPTGHGAISPKVQYGAGTAAALSGTVTSYVNNVTATPDTCVTYCHGGSLTAAQKGVITTWQWTTGVTVACNSCHATPPRDPVHASVATVAAATTGLSCVPCHNTTLTAAGAILFSGTGTAATTLHINGTRQNTATCTSCHGTLGVNAAPPTATNGTTTGVKVGAHQKHVTATNLKATALACTDCHVLPTLMTHATGVVDMTYGTLAKTGSLVPAPATINATWEATPTCTNYCHGQKWAGNANYAGAATAPSWNGTSTSAACNSCHLAPPSSTAHASVTTTKNCGDCHTGYSCTTANLAACTVNKTWHLNGVADFAPMSCGACHGSATARAYAAGTQGPQDSANNLQGSPPNDAAGLAASNQVGPHLGHVNPATPGPQYYKPVLCSECHTAAVNSWTSAGHTALSPKVQYPAGTAAALSGTVTSYVNNVTATPDTCVTYCHGGSLTAAQKGVITTWQWTTGVTVACNSCHATPPRDPVHASVATVAAATTGLSCVPCHNTTLTAAGAILFSGTGTAATTLHINGTRQNTATCTSCHGTLGVNAAPPTATNGTTTGVKVGAHQKHVTATNLKATALACTDCHVLPTLMTHATGVVDMTYGALAKTGSIVPTPASLGPATTPTLATWETTPTCTNYCHGYARNGNANYAGTLINPKWTDTAALATACTSCHKAPPSSAAHASVTTTTQCGTCHNGYTCTSGNLAACTVNKTWHIDGTVQSAGTCIDCHTGTQGTRRAIVPEFASAWSHKRSAVPTGTVTKFDCVVCHMEGNLTTGDPDPTWHPMTPGGNIDLRDPDTGLHIKGVTFTAANGTSPGSYATTATDMVFTEFSRNLAMVFESDPAAPTLQAIMINQCLKCHDSNGATAAFVPGGSATKPFNTTIAGTTYTGAGVTAGGVTGGVTDVNASFATTNASYHPIRGKQNNSYVSALRMNAPWTTITKTAGVINTTAAWGYLISCWDCHAPLGTGAVTLTASVTAHGGATILRQQVGTANATNLCTVCHLVVPVTGSSTSNHGAGSAFASGGNSGPGGIARTSCWRCHGGDDAGKAPRPYAGQNAHGFDSFSPVMGTDQMWPIGTTETYRPYAFMRSVGATGMWKTTAWKPLSGPGVTTGAATCGGSAALGSGCGSNNHGTYTPGGNF